MLFLFLTTLSGRFFFEVAGEEGVYTTVARERRKELPQDAGHIKSQRDRWKSVPLFKGNIIFERPYLCNDLFRDPDVIVLSRVFSSVFRKDPCFVTTHVTNFDA